MIMDAVMVLKLLCQWTIYDDLVLNIVQEHVRVALSGNHGDCEWVLKMVMGVI